MESSLSIRETTDRSFRCFPRFRWTSTPLKSSVCQFIDKKISFYYRLLQLIDRTVTSLSLVSTSSLILAIFALIVNRFQSRQSNATQTGSNSRFVRITCSILTSAVILAHSCLSYSLVNCSHEPKEVNQSEHVTDCQRSLQHFGETSSLVTLLLLQLLHFKALFIGCHLVFVGLTLRRQLSSIVFFLFFCLHFRDRYLERSRRSHFLWSVRLRVEQQDVEVMGGINKILLENILPQHVAKHFLSTRLSQTLYHERSV